MIEAVLLHLLLRLTKHTLDFLKVKILTLLERVQHGAFEDENVTGNEPEVQSGQEYRSEISERNYSVALEAQKHAFLALKFTGCGIQGIKPLLDSMHFRHVEAVAVQLRPGWELALHINLKVESVSFKFVLAFKQFNL